MYNYLVYLSIIYIIYYSKNIIRKKWSKWIALNKLMSQRTQNKYLIIWYSLCMIYKIIWLSMVQYLNNTVVCIGKNKHEVSYVINGKLYKFHTSTHRGPVPILQIINNDDIDVTKLVLPYMGPQFKGHGIIPTPHLLGYSSLTFEMSNGESHNYDENDNIKLN